MEHNKINFESRSQETRDILKNISGKGLKWGIYAFVVVFIVVLTFGSTFEFPTYYPVTTEFISTQKMKITNGDDYENLDFQSIVSVMIDEKIIDCKLKLKKNKNIEIHFPKDSLKDIVLEDKNIRLVGKKSVLHIIFNNIL